MTGNCASRSTDPGGKVLRWPGRVVSAEELRRTLNGHRELLLSRRAVLTPSAVELLSAAGIQVRRETEAVEPVVVGCWGVAQERAHAIVASAIGAVEREGVRLIKLPKKESDTPYAWARTIAEHVGQEECTGAVLFCEDGGLICCVANKLPGIRAVAVANVLDAARASANLGANLVAVPTAGRTFFELRQILRNVCHACVPTCPIDVAATLQELDGHAHR